MFLGKSTRLRSSARQIVAESTAIVMTRSANRKLRARDQNVAV